MNYLMAGQWSYTHLKIDKITNITKEENKKGNLYLVASCITTRFQTALWLGVWSVPCSVLVAILLFGFGAGVLKTFNKCTDADSIFD